MLCQERGKGLEPPETKLYAKESEFLYYYLRARSLNSARGLERYLTEALTNLVVLYTDRKKK